MFIKSIIYIWLLLQVIDVRAQDIIDRGFNQHLVIDLPWNDYMNELDLSFSQKHIEKVNKINQKYQQHCVEYKSLIDLSAQYIDTDLSMIDPSDTNNAYSYKVTSPYVHFRRQQQFLNQMQRLDNKMRERHTKVNHYDTLYDNILNSPLNNFKKLLNVKK